MESNTSRGAWNLHASWSKVLLSGGNWSHQEFGITIGTSAFAACFVSSSTIFTRFSQWKILWNSLSNPIQSPWRMKQCNLLYSSWYHLVNGLWGFLLLVWGRVSHFKPDQIKLSESYTSVGTSRSSFPNDSIPNMLTMFSVWNHQIAVLVLFRNKMKVLTLRNLSVSQQLTLLLWCCCQSWDDL